MTRFEQVQYHIIHKLERELSPTLYYHSLWHTQDVLRMVEIIAASEGISEAELELLKVSALLHDTGFLIQYKNHEEVGCEIATELLPQFGYTDQDIALVCGIIMATKIPQSPKNLLEEIICDADLDYLGREDFESIAKNLFDELKLSIQLTDERKWNEIQVDFIGKHQYFRPFGKENREPLKQKNLQKIKDWLATHV